MGVAIVEMGVEAKMAPEDQDGGYFHPTAPHPTSYPCTSWTDNVATGRV